MTDLSRVFALCAATDEAIELRDDIAFFQAIKAQLAKSSGSQRSPEELDHADPPVGLHRNHGRRRYH